MLCDRATFREKYLSIIDPFDARWNYERYEPGLWVKHQITHHVSPKKIVEIGLRSGYSAWAIIKAAPDAEFVGYDSYSPNYARSLGDNLSAKFEVWAHHILDPLGARIVKTSTQVDGFVPEAADLYHVDGDHSYEGAKRDIVACIGSGHPSSVVVVHDYLDPTVRRAVQDAALYTGWRSFEVFEPRKGDGLLFKDEVPRWARELELA